jgi:NADPH-dependent 2,4-dienoyl-CoA reductase/sulfur reductase-like enzyme/rhodanese-related sulfurtransferase
MDYDVVVIGGVAAGTKAAAKAKRENPFLKVAIVTSDANISYAGCGLPYYIGGIIHEQRELVVKRPEELKAEFDIDVFTRHTATEIDPVKQTVTVKNLALNRVITFHYEKLVIAAGSSPVVPPLPGRDLANIFTVRTMDDAVTIRQFIESSAPKNAVIIGGGFIGLETAENLKHQKLNVTIIEAYEHILPHFDKDIALHVENYLREQGINIYTGERVTGFNGDGRITAITTDKRVLDADFAILSIGVRPSVELTKNAGIALGATGAIQVNSRQETNLPHIYAVGDCAESIHAQTGKPAWFPMGSTANKTGRIAAINLTGLQTDQSAGVLGTTIIKLFDFAAGRTGLSEKEALALGYDIETVLVPANDKAHYFPGYRNIITKLVAERCTRKILGVQIIGEGVVDKPVDIFATAISFGATVDAVAKLDLAYAPPFSMAMSSSIVAANVMRNKLDGKFRGVSPLALDDPDIAILDIRTEPEFIIGTLPGAINIPVAELPGRIHELPAAKKLVVVCKVGKRAYLTLPMLKKHGIGNAIILDGGIAGYPLPLI